MKRKTQNFFHLVKAVLSQLKYKYFKKAFHFVHMSHSFSI